MSDVQEQDGGQAACPGSQLHQEVTVKKPFGAPAGGCQNAVAGALAGVKGRRGTVRTMHIGKGIPAASAPSGARKHPGILNILLVLSVLVLCVVAAVFLASRSESGRNMLEVVKRRLAGMENATSVSVPVSGRGTSSQQAHGSHTGSMEAVAPSVAAATALPGDGAASSTAALEPEGEGVAVAAAVEPVDTADEEDMEEAPAGMPDDGVGAASSAASTVENNGALSMASSMEDNGASEAEAGRNERKGHLERDWVPLSARWRKARPHPANPVVLRSRKVRAYLETIPKNQRDGVVLQARILNELPAILRSYVQKTMYDRGKDTQLFLRPVDGKGGWKLYNACITMANEKEFRVKSLDERQKDVPETVTFEQLSRKTVMDMLDYYCGFARERLEPSDPEYAVQRQQVVKHTLVLMMLADWYDEREAAANYAAVCLELQPKSRDFLAKFGYGDTTKKGN